MGLKLAARVGVLNDYSFTSAPQLKRGPLGSALSRFSEAIRRIDSSRRGAQSSRSFLLESAS